MMDNKDNLTDLEKIVLHQTKKMELHFKALQASIEELTKAVTAGNVIDKLAHLAGGSQQPMQAIPDKYEDEWRHL